MDQFEVDDCLRSMVVLVDTREQDTKRARERYSRFPVSMSGRPYLMGTMLIIFVLPYGSRFMEYSRHEVSAPIVVERKMNLDELAGCFTRSRKRFEAEFARAKENGARIYLLVENATWEKSFCQANTGASTIRRRSSHRSLRGRTVTISN